MNTILKIKTPVEVCYVLLGELNNGIWHAKLSWKSTGSTCAVDFDGQRVLEREEKKHDVVGFFHTHPEGIVKPSGRDDRTMKAWSFCFGKPLLCGIGTSKGMRFWVYSWDQSEPVELEHVGQFKNNWIAAVYPDWTIE